jgi:3-oxoacyl-[acyl-carrier protein] reductase
VAAEIARLGGESLVVQVDVGLKAQVQALVARTRAAFGGLDILVNCAGISLRAPLEEFPEEYWERIHRTNLKGTFLCSQLALPLLKESRGVILNVSSIHAATTTHNFAAYAASKGGIEALTRGLAIDLGQYGIRVNALRLGWILVERDAGIDEDTRRLTAERIPLGRIGEVEDVVGPAVFLCSDDSRYITGSVVVVDGGHEVIINSGFALGLVPGGAQD